MVAHRTEHGEDEASFPVGRKRRLRDLYAIVLASLLHLGHEANRRGSRMAESKDKTGTDWGKIAKWASRVGAVAGIVGLVARVKKGRKAKPSD
jgi:hypothetical protein